MAVEDCQNFSPPDEDVFKKIIFCAGCEILLKGTVERDFWRRFFHGSPQYETQVSRLKLFNFFTAKILELFENSSCSLQK
jgi:hypothetical protein